MGRAVIITSYVEYPVDIRSLLREDDEIVCLDGGYDLASKQGIRPDILLGDLDSMATNPETVRAIFESTTADGKAPRLLQYPTDKDFTDLELAFREIDPAEYPELLIIGGIGGRLDHTAVNLQLIARYTAGYDEMARPGGFKVIEMLDGRNRCFAIRGDRASYYTIPAQPDMYLSLLPMSETCTGVTLTGVKYPLKDATLRRGASLAISNEFAAEVAELDLREGTMLVICSRR